MKTLYSCLIILTFFTSCTTDSTVVQQSAIKTIVNKTANVLPGNDNNPYDQVGWLHNELFESYYASGNLATTISGIAYRVEAIADANTSFKAIKTSTYHSVSIERIQYLLNHKNTCVSDVISASSLTIKAKLSLTTFINSFIVIFDTEPNCDEIYRFVVDYEKEILNDNLLTAKDKQLILTTTSIARHSSYLAKKRPKKNTDPDWTILIVNVIGAADGAEFGTAESLVESLVGGIAQN